MIIRQYAALPSPATGTDLKSDGRTSNPMGGGTSAQRHLYGELPNDGKGDGLLNR